MTPSLELFYAAETAPSNGAFQGESKMMRKFNRFVASVLIVCTTGLGLPLPAQAGLVGTQEVTASAQRSEIQRYLDRQEVRDQLQAMGIDAALVEARVAALSDEEAQTLAERLNALPAGGDGVGAVVGALLVIFVILLITDLLGWTKVFPFTRTIK
ncbi:MAG: PA2779 family protein [Pseudomonadota bacterium]